MAISVVEAVAAVLATCQIVETAHHGSVFTGLRKWAYRTQSSEYGLLRFVGELLRCPFCLAHWGAGTVVLFVYLSSYSAIWAFPVWVLAATRGAQLTNDLLHSWSRSPARDEESVKTVVEEV